MRRSACTRAESVLCDPELAGAIGNDDCAVQEPLSRNAAHSAASVGILSSRIGPDLQTGEAEFLQMGHEGVATGKALLRLSKAGDGRLGQPVLAHVGERSFS